MMPQRSYRSITSVVLSMIGRVLNRNRLLFPVIKRLEDLNQLRWRCRFTIGPEGNHTFSTLCED
jgi:hypothetical protein